MKKTIAKAGEFQFKERQSLFHAYVFPVDTKGDVTERLQELKKTHPSATHICYAWRLGDDKNVYRANDDGEPSGTAGLPILNQIDSYGLTDVLLAVVRYYGGTKLGTHGLIQAYKHAAGQCLFSSEIIEKIEHEEMQFSAAFDQLAAVMRVLKQHKAQLLAEAYDQCAVMKIKVEKQKANQLKRELENLVIRP